MKLAPPALPDELFEQHQGAAWMALQDAETYMGYLAEKVKDPQLDLARELVARAYETLKGVKF